MTTRKSREDHKARMQLKKQQRALVYDALKKEAVKRSHLTLKGMVPFFLYSHRPPKIGWREV